MNLWIKACQKDKKQYAKIEKKKQIDKQADNLSGDDIVDEAFREEIEYFNDTVMDNFLRAVGP